MGARETGHPFETKPKAATIYEISDDLGITLEQLSLELSKNRSDKETVFKLLAKAKMDSVSINGLLYYNKRDSDDA
ncbi:hypothetical protein SAMN04487970_10747 [Paenibacillus tianmuensis]|uniref:Uncharacterized protein n=1 Tax=Paenibacillus tianmuensis TaxID=624147 RepID=A0A1G4TWX9_9BACL|nr:hypothetical protein SAMN04487970_10747 [Paenibacillus tianmuensis]